MDIRFMRRLGQVRAWPECLGFQPVDAPRSWIMQPASTNLSDLSFSVNMTFFRPSRACLALS